MNSIAQQSGWLYSALSDEDDDLADLVDLFVAEMPDRANELLERLESRDWEDLRRVAHQLRGAGGSYGFAAMTPAAARVEQAILGRQSEAEIRLAVEDLVTLCRRIRGRSRQ